MSTASLRVVGRDCHTPLQIKKFYISTDGTHTQLCQMTLTIPSLWMHIYTHTHARTLVWISPDLNWRRLLRRGRHGTYCTGLAGVDGGPAAVDCGGWLRWAGCMSFHVLLCHTMSTPPNIMVLCLMSCPVIFCQILDHRISYPHK